VALSLAFHRDAPKTTLMLASSTVVKLGAHFTDDVRRDDSTVQQQVVLPVGLCIISRD